MEAFQLEIAVDPAHVVKRAIAWWRQGAQSAIADHGSFRVALSGGTTPKALYQALANTPDLDWAHTQIFWGDERYVPTDHPDSNFKMAKEALLDHVPIPADHIFPIPTAARDPLRDADTYAQTLQGIFQSDWPSFDLMLLGIGDDGHTASLFPQTAALQVMDRWVTVGEKAGQPRITLTFPVLNHSQQVIFLVAGSSKAPIVQEVLTTPPHLPCQQVKPHGHLLWLIDAAAAQGIPIQAFGSLPLTTA
ncbi:MAG: 6-phosphogluconolactonase [Cyanobacteriota bacterium]|nr:6-phosphogluconolactonase [Cyanobacteriota bacterium]